MGNFSVSLAVINASEFRPLLARVYFVFVYLIMRACEITSQMFTQQQHEKFSDVIKSGIHMIRLVQYVMKEKKECSLPIYGENTSHVGNICYTLMEIFYITQVVLHRKTCGMTDFYA